ncbi:MAG: hypothetical protein SNJ55_06560 [Chloroherpetonaceae bacterium]
MKPIRLTKHATDRCLSRGATFQEVQQAIREGVREPVKANRQSSKMNFVFNDYWGNVFYPIKQVAPVFVEETNEIVVITVYTYYF